MVRIRSVARAGVGVPGDLVRAVGGKPTSPDTYLVIRRLNVRTAGRFSAGLASALRRLPAVPDRVTDDQLAELRSMWADEVAVLHADGVARVPDAFTPDELSDLVAFATNAPASLVRADGSSAPGTYAQRDGDVVSVRIDQSFLLAQPAIQAMMARAMASDIGTARNGLWSTVHPPILYWSCVSQATPDDQMSQRLARRFHSDYDGLGGLRLHVYLTDVDDASGPMDYVRSSHRPGALPGSMRRDATDEITVAEVHRRFGAQAVESVTGPAGTSFMSDSNGLHRGNAPMATDRLFLVMPLQAGSLAGAYNRVRRLPAVDGDLALALRAKRPDLRLFEAAPSGARVASLAHAALPGDVPTTR